MTTYYNIAINPGFGKVINCIKAFKIFASTFIYHIFYENKAGKVLKNGFGVSGFKI